jgi:hypothetical protein
MESKSKLESVEFGAIGFDRFLAAKTFYIVSKFLDQVSHTLDSELEKSTLPEIAVFSLVNSGAKYLVIY